VRNHQLTTTMSGEAPPRKIPDLSLAQSLFTLRTQPSSSTSYTAARTHLLTQIEEKSLAPLYLLLKDDLSDWSESTYDGLKKKNDEEEEKMDAKLNEAKEMNGESEVSEALIAKFTFLATILDKVLFPLIIHAGGTRLRNNRIVH
jgi:26S proteasome regulatory subunit N7